MFIGHFAVGFAGKRFAPRTNLALLIAAALFSDMLWPIFLLLGWEKVRIDPGNTRFTPLDLVWFPWSHSLLMTLVWATAFALIYYAFARYRAGACVIWIAVLSHWILDWITHRPDMPLYPGSACYGLGLWNSIPGTLVVELSMFAAGLWLYMRTTRPRDRIGRYAFFAFAALLLLLYVGDRFSSPPSGTGDIAWPGLIAEGILLPWAWWFDHHRALRIGEQKIATPA
ncbi:MAG TPA: metal-dependent hydrolase [Acidobacteriaceae bacterium]|jgi:membrane-bound metal-dependent hydrolase YbcI (DUF457 family)|nr:metal-dependent hydrolase [Acidobacteriaceae bacterium]